MDYHKLDSPREACMLCGHSEEKKKNNTEDEKFDVNIISDNEKNNNSLKIMENSNSSKITKTNEIKRINEVLYDKYSRANFSPIISYL